MLMKSHSIQETRVLFKADHKEIRSYISVKQMNVLASLTRWQKPWDYNVLICPCATIYPDETCIYKRAGVCILLNSLRIRHRLCQWIRLEVRIFLLCQRDLAVCRWRLSALLWSRPAQLACPVANGWALFGEVAGHSVWPSASIWKYWASIDH